MAQDEANARQRTKQVRRRTAAKWPRTPHMQHNAPSEHTMNQVPRGSGHRTGNTTHRAGTLVNRSQVALYAAQQHNATSGRTDEQEPDGPGHRTRNTMRRASTPVNQSQVAGDTAHTTQLAEGTL